MASRRHSEPWVLRMTCEFSGSRFQSLRKVWVAPLVAGALASLVGCGTISLNSERSSTARSGERVRVLERELKAKQSQIQNLKERNWVLEQRVKNLEQRVISERRGSSASPEFKGSVPVPFHPSAAIDNGPDSRSIPDVAGNRPSAPVSRVEKIGEAQTGEHFLYSKVLESYRTHQVAELTKSTELLLKTYPTSAFADNAVYLNGMLAFEKGELKTALRWMNDVLRRYPDGNKACAALFAKAIILKKERQYALALRLLLQIQSSYPGSPEAVRAPLEIKLLSLAADGRRES